MALYQPVSVDLRTIVAIMKINDNLEHIGDLAKEISKNVLAIIETQNPAQFDLSAASSKVKWMVGKCMQAVVEMDSDLAHQICVEEDNVDQMCKQTIQDIITKIQEVPEQTKSLLNELFIVECLEQMADKTKKISEDVIYTVDAEIVRHQTTLS